MSDSIIKAINKIIRSKDDEERWKRNIISVGPKVTLAVTVTAAEANGWRADVGYTISGMAIEDPKQMFKSEWAGSYEAAEKLAKSMARRYKIKWKPKPYGDRSKMK